MTRSTARHFAEQAYKLMLMRGKDYAYFNSKDGERIECIVGEDHVGVYSDGVEFQIKIAKCWNRFT